MFFDPTCKPQTETKADPFTLASLIAWLEQQPHARHYVFCQFNECLLGQWLRSSDPAARSALADEAPSGFFYRAHGKTVDLTAFKEIVTGRSHADHSGHTFGAALERARAALSSQQREPGERK